MQDTQGNCQYDDSDTDERYLAGALSAAEAEAFEHHYFGCDRCWARVQRGAEIKTSLAGSPVVAIDSRHTPRAPTVGSSATRWATPLAAAAVLMLGFGLWRYRGARDFTSVDAGAGDTTQVTRGSVNNIPVFSRQDGSMLIAAWARTPSASSYRVRLLAADGALLYERETPDTSLVLPDDSAGNSATTAYWEIQALNELRNVIAASALTPAAPQGARR